MGVDGETQPHRVARGGVGVLADDQHPDVAQGPREGAQHLVTRGKVAAAGSQFGAQEVAHGMDLGLLCGQRLGPVRRHQFADRPGAHDGTPSPVLCVRTIPAQPLTASMSSAPTPNAIGSG